MWRNDANTQKALAFIDKTLNTPGRFRLCYQLRSGEGVISNNVLHKRTAFSDDPAGRRLLYRARWNTRPGTRLGRMADDRSEASQAASAVQAC